MTIKKRLFLSNILMIVIPLVVSLAVFYSGLYVFTTVTGIRENRGYRDGRFFFESQMHMADLAEKWRRAPDEGEMIRDIMAFNENRGGKWPFILLYKDDELIFPAEMPGYDTSLGIATREPSGATVFGSMVAHSEVVGDYKAVLLDARTHVKDDAIGYRDVMRYGTIVALVCAVCAILLTNRFLTLFVFRSITNSLDTLADGVQQIHAGNLGYRIDYRGDDEFSEVCSEFNEMAARLEESINARQADEVSRRELIAGISHDLRTPLTSIKAYIEGIQKGIAATPETQKRYVSTIKSKADDLEHIINMLFTFSKLDTGEFPYRIERVRLADELRGTVATIAEEYLPDAPNAQKSLAISLGEDIPDVSVDIDVVQFRNVMFNILDNSAKYGRKKPVAVSIHVEREEDGVAISITDDGPGVSEEAIGKIFDVFYRGDPSRREPSRGSGLGLAISAKIISHFGGSITAENAPTGGLRVTIKLPVAE